ncbi:MAG: hypothetical protein EBS65_14705 [Betaproteobacteria bacterium]|nr:hypothetical protein [Betaproteobacteria bacterium]
MCTNVKLAAAFPTDHRLHAAPPGAYLTDEARAIVREADVVLSDMMPNVSGIPSVDQANAAALTELAIDFCHATLKPDGVFVVKVFQGEAFQDLFARMKEVFLAVATRKPGASRDESRETYLVGRGLRPAQVV